MAISRKRKEELVAIYNQILQNSTGFIVTEYRSMTVAQIKELRDKLEESNSIYVVTKNTLFKHALVENEWVVPDDLLVGTVATAFTDGNMPGMAKTLLEFQKEYEANLTIKGGVMLGNQLSAKEIEAISKLPSLDELRSQLAGLLVQPATGLVGVLNAATADIVNVLHAYVQENSEDAA